MEDGAKLWDALWEAGQPHGVVPAGIGVYGTTGRLEKATARSAPSSTPTTTSSRRTWRGGR